MNVMSLCRSAGVVPGAQASRIVRAVLAWWVVAATLHAFDRPEVTFQVYQFPADKIPRVDGDPSDWAMVPDRYAVRTEQFVNESRRPSKPGTLDVAVRVGWVKGLNRLYFLYEATDDYWDFSLPGLHNDTFEIIVDGDASGGPLLDKGHKEFWTTKNVSEMAVRSDDRLSVAEAHWASHGAHAQNYHIFTPAEGKDWALSWNAASWTKEMPWANAVCRHDVRPGEPGKVVLEFWITPFDYAGPEGPERAVESVLRENKLIGLGLIVIDYDDVAARGSSGFWNLSRQHHAYGDASSLCAFKLMPLEPEHVPAFEARWSFRVVDHDRRLVAFKDESVGPVARWAWDFGDGTTSEEQHPIHAFKQPGSFVTVLEVTTEDGKTARRSKVWDVQLR